MEIVVLDGYTLNPGDLSWEPLESLGSVVVYDRTPADEIVEKCRHASAILTNKVPITAEVIASLPSLRYIGVLATGYNIIDIEAASRKAIVVSNAPAYGTSSVAQHCFSLLLALCQHAEAHSLAVRAGKWTQSPDFCFSDFPLVELSGKTMGIFGWGNIGKDVARMARAFGMQVIVNTRTPREDHQEDISFVSFEELLNRSDALSIHAPLTPATRAIFNKETISRMKRSAFLLNTSRGPIISEEDLAICLNEGLIAGAGLDVLSTEPPPGNNPLFSAKNCIITPHIAWATIDARKRLFQIVLENLRAFMLGNPKNVVNSVSPT